MRCSTRFSIRLTVLLQAFVSLLSNDFQIIYDGEMSVATLDEEVRVAGRDLKSIPSSNKGTSGNSSSLLGFLVD